MKPLNIAVVGYGLIGKNHADIVIKNNKFRLSGIVEINKKNLNNFSKQYEIFNSIEELLVNKKIDGAIIATPTDLHYEHSKKFLEKGIPILIEKPISNSLIEANKLINLSKKNKTPILVGHHRRHNNIIKRAKTAIDEGLLGNIRSIISICWFYKPDEYFNIAPWRKEIGAGPISVNLIHDVDLLRYLCGDIKSVFSTISMSKRGFKNEDLASVIFNFVSGATANLTVSDSIVSPWSWEMTANEFNATKFPKIEQNCYLIGGSEASLSIPDLKIWSYKETKDWRSKFLSKNLNFEYNNPFLDQINHFYDVITKGSKPIVSGQEGLESLKAIDAIQKSIKTKKIINL